MRALRVQLLTAGALMASGIPFHHSAAQAVAPTIPPSQIVASASGESTVTPDRGRITFAVETRAATAAAAGQENARRQKRVMDALKSKGIAAERITTSGYSVLPDEKYDKGQRQVVGYIARNSVLVDVDQIDQVGAFIDAALGAGANIVSGLDFYSSKMEQVRRSALEQAVKRARADAETMATAAGGTLGDALEISTNDVSEPRPMVNYAMRAEAAAVQTPIAVGEQKVSVMVTTRWLFIAGRR